MLLLATLAKKKTNERNKRKINIKNIATEYVDASGNLNEKKLKII